MIRPTLLAFACSAVLLSGCSHAGSDATAAAPATNAAPAPAAEASPAPASAAMPATKTVGPFAVTPVAQFDEPWAMTFLPDGRALVTQKRGTLRLVDPATGAQGEIGGVPAVAYGGQGGLGDVILHPQFATNGIIYLSYAEDGDGGTRGAAVARAVFTADANGGGALSQLEVIWRQVPKVSGQGHYGHRLAFGPDALLYIASGDRQKFDPAQDMTSNMGKILRLKDDGSLPPDNPFADQGDVAAQVWSLGHRNPLGIAFDAQGRLWNQEMGPKGGDEFNLVERGANYGYPIVSDGDHYDGRDIPDHATRPEFAKPKVVWTPVIAPAGLIIYSGRQFPQWQGSAFIGGLASQALVRVTIDGDSAREAERFDFGRRIREVEQGPDGALWLLEDGPTGEGGRLLKLMPVGGAIPEADAGDADGTAGAGAAGARAGAAAAAGTDAESMATTARFRCGDAEVNATFTADGNVVLDGGLGQYPLAAVASASGAHFADAAGNDFWTKGDEAMLTIAGQPERRCEALGPA